MPILHECHGMSTEEAMMEGPKRIWVDRKVIYQFFPPNDEAVEYTRSDLVRESVEAAEDLIDSLDKIIHPAFVGYAKIEALRAALAALKAMGES